MRISLQNASSANSLAYTYRYTNASLQQVEYS